MKIKTMLAHAVAVAAVGSMTLMPMTAAAQSRKDHQQTNKNNWRNLTIGSGLLGLFGLLKGDKTLFFLGTAGALYSANRYEQDRKSQSKADRARAAIFSKTSFKRDGVTYYRHMKTEKGKRYYYFSKKR